MGPHAVAISVSKPTCFTFLEFLPRVALVKKGKEGEAAAVPRLPSSSKPFCPQEGTVY